MALPWMLFASRWDTLGWSDPPLSLGSAVALTLAAQAASALGLAGNWTLNTLRTMMLPSLALLLLVITLLEIGSGWPSGPADGSTTQSTTSHRCWGASVSACC